MGISLNKGREIMKIKNILKEFSIITGGTAIIATGVYFFMLPSQVSVGSVTALAMVLSNFIQLPVSAITLIINIGLVILGLLLVGREFGIKTIYCTILLPILLGVFEVVFPNFQSITQDPLLDMVSYILIGSAGQAIIFTRNASSGGLDIVAKIMNKFLRMEVGKALSYSGIAVALTSALCYDSKTVVLSVLGTYFAGMIVDYFIFGIHIKRRVCVISQELDTIVDFVLYQLHSGATMYESIGAYGGKPRMEMVTIVDKNEYRKLMDYIRQVDPKAFVTVYSVNEVCYQPKK